MHISIVQCIYMYFNIRSVVGMYIFVYTVFVTVERIMSMGLKTF